jgi:hypothetical protein
MLSRGSDTGRISVFCNVGTRERSFHFVHMHKMISEKVARVNLYFPDLLMMRTWIKGGVLRKKSCSKVIEKWSRRSGLNGRPADYEVSALLN